MPRASARFYEHLRRSHQVLSFVDVISPTKQVFRLPAIDGDVTVDGTAAVRRACRVKCVDPLGDLTPRGVDSILTPYGTEIRPYRGIRFSPAEGDFEVHPLGVFRLSKTQVSDKVGGSPEISIEAFDYSRTVARDKFTTPYTIEAGTNVVSAIKQIIARTFPAIEYDAMSTSVATTATQVYDAGADPWEAVTKLAESAGCEVYFDVEARVVIAPSTDPDALPSPDFDYIEGAGCIMLDLDQTYSDEPGHNGVIVTGESPGDEQEPVRAEAWDDDPKSATYRRGPYGEVPMFHTDQVVKTVAEAQMVANQKLRGLLGFHSQLSVSGIPNPTYEVGDVVRVERKRSAASGLYIVDAFGVPLGASGTQTLTLRQKRSSQ